MTDQNEIEVKVTGSTSDVENDFTRVENKVKDAAKGMRDSANTIKTAFNSIKNTLKNIDVKINVDTAALQTTMNGVVNTIRTQVQAAGNAASIKVKVDNAELANIRNQINSAFTSTNGIKLKFDRSSFQIELNQIRTRINAFFSTAVNGIRIKLNMSQNDLTAIRARISTLTSSIFKAKVGIDLAYLNSQIAHARAMLGAIGGSLNINIDATATGLITALNNLKAEVIRLIAAMNSGGGNGGGGGNGAGGDTSLLAGLRGQLGGLLAGYVGVTGAAAAFNKVISSQREFDILNAQLETATKSSENAKIAFDALQDFAKKTPYSLNQAVEGFTKLVNLGLTPSERALMSYGNTASAMGKDLMQFIEAVADASTSEFERLKEFGIKAKQQGDKVALTFQGTTKTIGNNAKEIEEYLIKIGETEFAGSMAKRVDTLDGAIASLSDTWDALFRAVSDMGVGDVVKKSANQAENSINDLITLLKSGAVQTALSGISRAFSVFGDDAESDMKSIASTFSWLGDYLVDSWRNTINEINALGNIFTTMRSYVQKVAVGAAAGVDIVTDPFNRRTTNQQKQENYESSMSDIDRQRDGRTDTVKRNYDDAVKKWNEFKAKQAEEDKKKGGDDLAQFKIKSKDEPTKKDGDSSGGKKSSAESKYEPTTYSDLRIKSPEAYSGGKAHQGILDLAGLIQDKFQITRFTAFNDNYHKGTSSKHAQGLAMDFGLQDASKSGQVATELRAMLGKNGVNAQVLDEYKNPSKRATGGHIHVSFNSQADADKYLALTKSDKVKGDKKSSSDSQYERFLEEQNRKAEQAEKERLDLKYKYASEQEKIQSDLEKDLDRISKSTASTDEKNAYKVQAEQLAQDKIVALNLMTFEKMKPIYEREIQYKQDQAQIIYEQEKARIQADFDANRIGNIEKAQLEKKLEDQLYQIKRDGLLARLDLEDQQSSATGKEAGQAPIVNNIKDLDNQKAISDINTPKVLNDAEMADFEDKFGGLTSRMSGLWDKGIQSMMNGTLTWKNAMNAIFTELAGAFIQSMISEPLKKYAASLAKRIAMKLGFIKTETAAEVAGQAAQTGAVVAGETTKTMATSTGALARLAIKAGEAIKSIMMYAWEAMAGAFKAMVSIPYIGPVLAVAAGASALALVGGLAGKIKSARGGYDIPAGVNPVTQLHEEEMVLPKQHANTIRALGKSLTSDGGVGGGGGTSAQTFNNFTIQAWDSKDVRRFMEKHGRELAGGLKGYNRNFGR